MLRIMIITHMPSNADCPYLQELLWLEVPARTDFLAVALCSRDLQEQATTIR